MYLYIIQWSSCSIPCVPLEYPFSIPSVSLQYPFRTSSVSLQYTLSIPTIFLEYPFGIPSVFLGCKIRTTPRRHRDWQPAKSFVPTTNHTDSTTMGRLATSKELRTDDNNKTGNQQRASYDDNNKTGNQQRASYRRPTTQTNKKRKILHRETGILNTKVRYVTIVTLQARKRQTPQR